MNETANLLSLMDTCRLLGVHPCTLYRWERTGVLKPLCRVGQRRIYSKDAVESFAQRYHKTRRSVVQ
jgi:predicted site-specific integrase-resolvase